MFPTNLKPEWIRMLNEIGKQLAGVTVRLPTDTEFVAAKAAIEQILTPPQKGYVRSYYVKSVFIALEYAQTHFRCGSISMLDDIKAGKTPIISDYE